MSEKTVALATKFVDLSLGHENWELIKQLPDDSMKTIFDTVSAAGFNFGAIVLGRLVGRWMDQDGPTGETYPINQLCPYKVLNNKGEDYFFATGWLDCAVRRVVYGSRKQKESREELVAAIAAEIERSVPLSPIQLTIQRDMMREYPPAKNSFGLEYFVEHTKNDSSFSCCVGVHERCDGWMDRQYGVSKTHDAIVCRSCRLRVLFPNSVKTYGELRHAIVSQFVGVRV